MEKVYEQTMLFDFYGDLLTDKQKDICRMHLTEDLSRGEIAETQGISRQGVYDTLRRAQEVLEYYESKLHMVRRFLEISRKVAELPALAEQGQLTNGVQEIQKLLSM